MMKAIYKKELQSLAYSFTGYLFSAIFLLSFGIFSYIYNLTNCQAGYASVISLSTLPMIILIPILTMRSFSEERHQKSDVLLFSLPIDMWQVVFGKFFAYITWLLGPFLIIALYPLGLNKFGDMNLVSSYGALIAFYLLNCTLISIGIFISSLTENQMISAAISFVVILSLYLLPVISTGISTAGSASVILFSILFLIISALILAFCKNIIVASLFFLVFEIPILVFYIKDIRLMSGKFAETLNAISLFNYFGAFTGGIFDIATIILFLTVSAMFLFFTVQTMERRRWN